MSEQRLIAGRFTQGDILGGGGMGDVYHGTDTQDDVPVAIKVLRLDVVALNPDMLERFAREGDVLRRLNHPNIVKMLAVVEEDGRHMLVMEYVSGGSLSELLAKEGALPVKRVLEIALDMADALTRAHRLRVIHRDIKPGNVLLAEDGTPRLTDFGVARVSDRTRMTETGSMVGTLAYLSPEACLGEEIEAASDIWAFGVMLFEMLSGKRPFDAGNPMALMHAIVHDPAPDLRTLRPEVPPDLAVLVQRMLAKDPAQRIPSVRQVGATLEAILLGLEPPEETHIGRPSVPPSRFGTPTPATSAVHPEAVPVRDPDPTGAVSSRSAAPSIDQQIVMPEQAAPPIMHRTPLIALLGVVGVIAIVLLVLVLGGGDGDDEAADADPDAGGADMEPTALVADPADFAAGEMVVVIAQFEQEAYQDMDAQHHMVAELEQLIARQEFPARVIAIPHAIAGQDQAQEVSAIYRATLVIYGSVTPGGAEVHVDIAPYDLTTGTLTTRPALESLERFSIRVSSNDVDDYAAYVFEGMDAQYIMSLSMGVLLFYADEDAAALEAFDQAEMAMDPARQDQLRHDVLAYYRASAFYFLHDYEEALEAIEIALTYDPDNARYRAARGRFFNARGEYQNAIDDLSFALESVPDAADLYLERGSAYYGQGEYDKALDDFNATIEFAPGDPWAYLSRANLYADQERYEEAFEDYTNALALNPDFALAYAYRGTVYHEIGEPDAAIDDYNTAIGLEEFLPLPYYQRALIYLDRGELELALADLEFYINLIGDDPDVRDAINKIKQDLAAIQTAPTPTATNGE